MLGISYIIMLNTNKQRNQLEKKPQNFTGKMKQCKQKQGKNLVYIYLAYNSTTETTIILLLEMHLFFLFTDIYLQDAFIY